MPRFDVVTSPLEGRNLLEASAGTGKTYALAGLYLRLLVESELPVGRILVVTFTEAATEELRDRIRRRLREALHAFGSPESGPAADDLLKALVERCEPSRATELLATALADFDEAAIFTIHGFCARVLSESAFECGSPFDAELVPDLSSLARQAVEDFWRARLFQESPEFLRFLLEKGNRELSPEALLRLLATASRKPELTVLPEAAEIRTDALEQACRDAFARVGRVWTEGEEEVCELLLHGPGLKRQSYSKRNVPVWIGQLREYLCSGAPEVRFENFRRFCTSGLADAAQEGCTAPEHPFFDACEELRGALDELQRAFAQKIVALKAECLRFAGEELERRKRERNQRSYDDLLLDLKRALDSPTGEELAGRLRKRYAAALIDEFQDTDSVQYSIFRQAFGSGETALFFIGDPKQAIYGFRGADVFSYLGAAQEADRRYTLGVNWRSSARLVSAVNALFENRCDPFRLPEISFEPVVAARKAGEPEFELDGARDPTPFKLWLAERGEGQPTVGKGEGTRWVADAVADEVAALLKAGRGRRATIGREPLQPADVAVLVRSNRQASVVQAALGARGVPSVVQSTGSLFESREAEEMLRLLRALAEPADEGKVKAALLTDLLGVTGDGLAELLADEPAWAERLQDFRDYHELWVGKGLLAASRVVFAREAVRERLLPREDGERRLTNLLHCCEALHEASLEGGLGPERLIGWLGVQLKEPSEADEHQLRLETDAQAVRIVTIHRSKGLEYPIVFCPFCWGAPREDEGPVSFHLGAPRRGEFLDLGSEAIEAHRELAREELLAEDLRLLYVAVTRAKHRCYLAWGAFRDAERSALAYLLHSGPEAPGSADARKRFSSLSDEELRAELRLLEARSGGALEVVPLPRPSGDASRADVVSEVVELTARSFRGRVPEALRLSSFTGLVSAPSEADQPDRDHRLLTRGEEETAPGGTFLAFPRGARAGQCVHEIFEAIDFGDPDSPTGRSSIAKKLGDHGFGPEWLDPVLGMVRDVLRLELIADGPFSLGALRPDERAHEVEFLFPCAGLTPRGLREFFRTRAAAGTGGRLAASLAELGFAPTSGFLKGFIDLVFCTGGRYYVVDWKSNYLGSDPGAYGREALEAVMVEEQYVLQYHLYALALHKHLQRALAGYDYDAHFGGIYYLFLRGVRAELGPDAGVFYDRPPRSFLEEFERFLRGDTVGGSR